MFPQFTLNARIIFLLMVMIAFVTTACTKHDYVLTLKTHSNRAIHINPGGKVIAADISLAQNFTMGSLVDFRTGTLNVTLYAAQVGRYLCFRRKGKLVGMKKLTDDCYLKESLDHGYYHYAHAGDPTLRVGFTKGFRAVGPRQRRKPQVLRKACFSFEKIDAANFVAIPTTSSTTTTTTTTTSTTSTTTTTRRPMHGRHHHFQEKANHEHQIEEAIRKERPKPNRARKTHLVGEIEADNDVLDRRQPKRRKQQRKSAATQPQPKNLVRHQHNNATLVARRRKHYEREQLLRRQRKEWSSHATPTTPTPSTSSSSATATATTALTAATASLAPSALNIVAMLAASRRKRGRRKKAEGAVSAEASQMDMQIVAQTSTTPTVLPTTPTTTTSSHSIIAGDDERRFYEQVNADAFAADAHPHKHRHRHHHNYHQQPPQQTEYSNSNVNSNLNNLKSNLKRNHAIPALPKNYLYNKHRNDDVHNVDNYDVNTKSSSTDYNSSPKYSQPSPSSRYANAIVNTSSRSSSRFPQQNGAGSIMKMAKSVSSSNTNPHTNTNTNIYSANANVDNNFKPHHRNRISKLIKQNLEDHHHLQHSNHNTADDYVDYAGGDGDNVDVPVNNDHIDDVNVNLNNERNDDEVDDAHRVNRVFSFQKFNVNNDRDEHDNVPELENVNDDDGAHLHGHRKRFFRSLNSNNDNNNYNHNDDEHFTDETKNLHNKYEMSIVQYRYVVYFIEFSSGEGGGEKLW